MQEETEKVIPINRFITKRQHAIADLAYEYWQARFGVQYGAPEDDLAKAQRDLASSSGTVIRRPYRHDTTLREVGRIGPVAAKSFARERNRKRPSFERSQRPTNPVVSLVRRSH